MGKKFASLDGLRGIAILLVIASHFGGAYVGQPATIFLGNAGVILFFFLSGFLMDKTLSVDTNLISYATRRAFRILPMYWFSILVVIMFGADWTPTGLVANATFSSPIFGQPRMLGVYWTLYIEVLFYAIAPLLVLTGTINLSTYVALGLFIAFAAIHGVGSGAPFYLIFCLCGMQTGSWFRKKSTPQELTLSLTAVAILSSLLMPVSIFLGIIPLGCAAALLFCLRYDGRCPPLEFIGHVSYSWYLLHSIFGYKFSAPVGILVTLAASVVTYYAIERPLIRLGRRFYLALAYLNASP